MSRHRRAGRRVAPVLTAVAAAVTLAACSQAVAGTGQADKDLSVGLPQQVNPRPTTPAPTSSGPLPSFGESVTIIESRRLAYATPRPDVVDPTFTKTCLPTLPLKKVDAMGGFGGLFVDESVDVFRKNGFIAGYVQCRSDPRTGRGTVAAAIEMRDEASARRVCAELVPTLTHGGDHVVPLNGLTEARAVTSFDKNTERHVVQTVVPFGRLVLYQYSDDKDSKRLGETVVKTMQSALARAQKYVPTDLDRMNRLADDPRHLRPLLADPAGTTYVNGGGYSLDAYYGQAEDPEAERALLTDAGFKAMYQNLGDSESYSIYELRDPAAAKDTLDGFITIEKKAHPDIKPLSVPAAGSSSFCVAFMVEDTAVQRCFFLAAKYLYQVDAYGFASSDLTNPGHVAALVTKQKARAPK